MTYIIFIHHIKDYVISLSAWSIRSICHTSDSRSAVWVEMPQAPRSEQGHTNQLS